MEKKKYQAPAIKVFKVAFEGNLLDWSAPKETGGGNVPEAKAFDALIESENNDGLLYTQPNNGNLWTDEDEE